MLAVIWGVDGFHVVDLMTSQCCVNSEYFVSHVLAPMVGKVFPRRRIPHPRQLQLHLDNCRVHFSKATEQFSLKTISDVCLTHLTDLILHH
jgi:hypothetical protein